MEIKSLDEKGRKFLVQEEGLILHPYRDGAGIPTIGIGCTWYPNGNKVTMNDAPLADEVAAWDLFDKVNATYLMAVYSTTRDDINQNQFNALVSLCYNIGTGNFKKSTLLKIVNERPNDSRITEAFYMWRFSTINATKKPILAARRIREAKLYFN